MNDESTRNKTHSTVIGTKKVKKKHDNNERAKQQPTRNRNK